MGTDGASFDDFVRTSAGELRRAAYLLVGDWAEAEDLTQGTFVRVYGRWRYLQDRSKLQSYARRVLLNLYLDSRRPARTREILMQNLPDRPSESNLMPSAEKFDLLAVLDTLDRRHRAVLVLRFWEDLDVATVAKVMKIPVGTVKSLTSRSLAMVRFELERRGSSEKDWMGR